MVSSQEVIERSIYSSILGVTIGLGYTVNPDDYLPINQENSARFKADIAKLKKYACFFTFFYSFTNSINVNLKLKNTDN